MEGDATGLNNLAGLGLLNTDSALYYAGTLAPDPARLRQLSARGAHLVVTDTNRKEAFRWDTLTANAGYTETPSDNPAKTDLSDSPVALFPDTGMNSKTVATYVGAVNVTASSYGNSVSYTPEDQAYSAIDGNFDTAWITGTFLPNPAGQWWQTQFGHQVTTDHITLVQPQRGDRSRWVSAVTLTFDGKHPMRYDLTSASHATTGQTLHFPTRTFHTLRITLDGTTDSHVTPLNASAVGFSEVEIPGQTVRQVIQMPSQMLSALGSASTANRVTIVMTRQRTSQYPPRDDPETNISRSFSLPASRTFTLSGSGSLSALIPDDEIDRLVGRVPAPSDGYVAAYSSGRLPGDLRATASATVDGNPTTAWQPGLGTSSQLGTTLTYDLSHPIVLDHLSMQVIADGRHSVPTSMTITAENSAGTSAPQVRTVTLPPIADSTVPGAVTNVPVTFPTLIGSRFVVTFTGVRDEYAANYYSAGPLALPLGIAEIGLPGVQSPPTPAQLPGNCVSNLLSIDGQPIDVALVGSTQNALNGGEVQVVPCGPDAHGITLGPGTHVVQTATGHTPNCAPTPSTCTGWDLDQLVLDSAAGGGAGPAPRPDGRRDASAARHAAGPGSRRRGHREPHRLEDRHRHRRNDPLRAGARRERRQGVACHGGARTARSSGFPRRRPRHPRADRRLRQRLAGLRPRPGCTGGLQFHRGDEVDPAEPRLGCSGAVGRHDRPMPGRRFPADPLPPLAASTTPSAPPGSGRTGRTGAAVGAVRLADADDPVRHGPSADRRTAPRSPADDHAPQPTPR